MNEPWYKQGLRFECTQCGNCCTGEAGFVWVSDDEIEALANRLGESDLDEFERLYLRRIGARKSLIEFPNGDCVFFDPKSRSCSVYEQRPLQCRSWPFWASNLETEADWQRTCQDCPGAGKGTLYELADIEQQRDRIKI